jgi:tetratricopeptide (TPR) repeat protein
MKTILRFSSGVYGARSEIMENFNINRDFDKVMRMLNCAEKSPAIGLDKFNIWNIRSLVHLENFDLQKAESSICQADDYVSNSITKSAALNTKFLFCLKKGLYSLALEYISQALFLNPTNKTAIVNYMFILGKCGEFKEIKKWLGFVQKRFPEFLDTKMACSIRLHLQNDPDLLDVHSVATQVFPEIF